MPKGRGGVGGRGEKPVRPETGTNKESAASAKATADKMAGQPSQGSYGPASKPAEQEEFQWTKEAEKKGSPRRSEACPR